MDNIRTDLAEECRARVGKGSSSLPGVNFSERVTDSVTVSELSILDDEGAKALGKPVGRYITIGFGNVWLLEDHQRSSLIEELASALCLLLGRKYGRLLIAGLGNKMLTSDSIGPMTLEGITVTRHLKSEAPTLFAGIGKPEISAVCPGVLGETGIESSEIVKKAAEITLPDAVIVIDSLAARSPDRLMRTVQLCDSGISPGSGIGNNRKPINSKLLGCPVISLGVPTVVDLSTIALDMLQKGGIDKKLPECLEKEIVSGRDFFVSPKECDIACRELSSIISEAINISLTY